MINANALDALRPLAGILADYDTACAEAERLVADARARAEDRLRALGIADLSALVPAAAPAAPEEATTATGRKTPAVSPSTGKRRDGKIPHPCAGGCGQMVVGTRCRACNVKHQAQQRAAAKPGGAVLTLPGTAAAEPAPEGDGGQTAPQDAPIPPYSRAGELSDHAMAIMAARSNGINNKRAEERGEFLVIRLTREQDPARQGGFVAVADAVPPGVEIIERVFRRGEDWYISLPGEDVRIGRRQAGALVPVSVPRNGVHASASA